MTTSGGSYHAGTQPAGEAERLRAQSSAIWERERAALDRAGLAAGDSVLEVGCGPGAVLERLGSALGRRAVGIDLGQAFLLQARAVGHAARADGAALPFAGGVFDFVLLRLVLRHAPARSSLLAEAARVTRVGGTVAVVDVDEGATAFDPEPASWPRLKQALAESAVRRGGDPFVGRRLPRLLVEAGLVEPVVVMLPVTTKDLPPSSFVEIMLAPSARPVDPDILGGRETETAWRDLREWARLGRGFGYALGMMVAARKPDGPLPGTVTRA